MRQPTGARGTRSRRLITGTVMATAVVLGAHLAGAGAAMATLKNDDGQDPGEPASALSAVLLFIGAPLLVIAIISLLYWAPQWAHGVRYRPGSSWFAEPTWFGGPAGQVSAAPMAALPAGSDKPALTSDVSTLKTPGGASARW